RAETSSGTYIRSLAHDMGRKAGTGAHLGALKREQVGEFRLDNAFTPEQLEHYAHTKEISKVVTPIEILLPEFPKIVVNPGGRKAVINGMYLMPGDVVKVIAARSNDYFRIFDDEGKLLAIARKDPKLMRFKPYIVFPIN
ncbi:MAG: tRNA pseudouridine(55) synthase TruB, partial [bacterium]|nr:tRNA pseudouridine(55) synthase TruB [bacterium]